MKGTIIYIVILSTILVGTYILCHRNSIQNTPDYQMPPQSLGKTTNFEKHTVVTVKNCLGRFATLEEVMEKCPRTEEKL